MSADLERKSGITVEHIKGIEATAREVNAFILIRPTNLDSTRLIRMGYATKSMDVHDKSSNWGPMSGFVPCDPAFNKNAEVMPEVAQQEHEHGEARKVQLNLTEELLASLERDSLDEIKGVGVPNARFYKARKQDKGVQQETRFKLEKKGGEWLVSYAVTRDVKTAGQWKPLMVWAYSIGGAPKPVTGDYDLWMVAPHIKYLTTHGFNISRLAARTNADPHGDSASSLFTKALIVKLNQACFRETNPVFRHGAEARNYGFTQKLDDELAMFTPGSGSGRMIAKTDLPKAIADMSNRGYVPIWNKRYEEDDPALMGRSEVQRADKARSELEGVDLENALRNDREAVDTIRDFNKKLYDLLATDVISLHALREDDFPRGSNPPPVEIAAIQRALQKAIVSSASGKGESQMGDLAGFYAENFEDLQLLFGYWSSIAEAEQAARRGTGLGAIPATLMSWFSRKGAVPFGAAPKATDFELRRK